MTICEGSMLGDRYVLTRSIAGGGMGEVWIAIDRRLDREVAVKVLRSEFGRDELTRQRFRFEAQAAARLASSGIASVFDYGEEPADEGNDRAYIVMELVHGESLEERVRRADHLSVEETLDFIGQAAAGLQVAHDHGLVHRDIKPGNLLVRTDGIVKLTDFGIARALDASSLTQTGTLVGTVRYMSPEQLSGQGASPASDIYALGIVAYFCLAGHTPFDHDESMAVAMAHVHDPLPALPRHVPTEVAELVSRMLAKDPASRPASAADVAREAEALSKAAPPALSRARPLTRPTGGLDERSDDAAGVPAVGSPFDADYTADRTLTDRRQTVIMPAPPAGGDAPSGPRRRWPWVLATTVVVALVAGLTLWRITTPAQVAVPHLTGLATLTAEARVDQVGLRADRHLVDVNRRVGQVVSQTPRPGASVAAGSHVVLGIASGFVALQAGTVQGRTAAQAAAVLASLGLHPVETSVVSTTAPGTVLSITPTGRIRLGTSVAIDVAVAPPPPPPTTTTTTTVPKARDAPSRAKHGSGKQH
jgi:serine/threonine-protein kinase